MRNLLLSLAFMMPFCGFAQQKTVTVPAAGSLSTVISVNEGRTVKYLKINGELNGTDIKYIHQMTNGKSQLSELDLSDASIIKGGESYANVGALGAMYTDNDDLASGIFSECFSLKSIVIPNTVSSINNSAFSYCPSLSEIKTVANKNYTSISGILYTADSTTLVRCPQAKNLVKCEIPSFVKHVNVSAFRGVKSITTVILPSGLQDLNDYAFYGCPNIKEVISYAENPPFYENSFDANVVSKVRVKVPVGAAETYKSVEGWNGFHNITE